MIQSKSYELIEAQDSQPSLVMMKSTEDKTIPGTFV